MVMNMVGRAITSATPTAKNVNPRTTSTPIASATSTEKVKTVRAKMKNRSRGVPVRAILASRNAY